MTTALPPIVDQDTWRAALDELRAREKAATRELDAIAAQRGGCPWSRCPITRWSGEDGPVRLADVFDGRDQLIVYNHMWSPRRGVAVRRLHGLHLAVHPTGVPGGLRRPVRHRHQRGHRRGVGLQEQGRQPDGLVFVVGELLRRRHGCGSRRTGFAVNVFLRDGDTVYRTWHTDGRGTEQLSHSFALIDLLPWGRQEEWQDSPAGWPKSPTYSSGSTHRTLRGSTDQRDNA